MIYELKSTELFEKWLAKLKDQSGKIKILARLDRVQNGNFGDCKQIGEELYELRFSLCHPDPEHRKSKNAFERIRGISHVCKN